MLSNYCCNVANDYGTKSGNVNQLVPNLGHKSKYVLHCKNLQLLGMKLTNVYRVLKFKQCDWMIYIDFNTDKRKKTAANSFEKDFFKLQNNSAYGKKNGKFKEKNKC